MVTGMALSSESAIGKKISQGLRARTHRFATGAIPESGPADDAMNPRKSFIVSKWPSGGAPIEIIRHVSPARSRDRLDAVERQTERFGARGHSGGLHFDRTGSRSARLALLRPVWTTWSDRARSCRELSPVSGIRCIPPPPEETTQEATTISRDLQARVESAAESGAHHRIRLKAEARIHRCRGAFRTHAVGHQQHLVRAAQENSPSGRRAGSRPLQNARELHRVGSHHQEFHAACAEPLHRASQRRFGGTGMEAQFPRAPFRASPTSSSAPCAPRPGERAAACRSILAHAVLQRARRNTPPRTAAGSLGPCGR